MPPPFLILFITLTFDLLTLRSSQFIFVPNCTDIENLVKFPKWFIKYHVHKLLGQMDTRIDEKPENTVPVAAKSSEGTKIN